MILRLWPTLVASLSLLGIASPLAAQGVDSSAVDRIVREAMKSWGVPGVALVVVREGQVAYFNGFGRRDVDRPEPIDPDTLFPLASCTKAFTVADLALLADDGRLKWDDPVRQHVPDFHLADPNADNLVTLRDLVSHRTGVRGHDLLWYKAPWGQEESIRRMSRMPLEGQFRSTYAYNSIMFMVAGKAVGKFHTDGWAGFTRERLLTPLGMKNTVLTGAEFARNGNRAHGYRRNHDGQFMAVPQYPMPVPNSAGSVYISARDLGNWLLFQLGDGTWRGKRLLSSESLEEMHKPQVVIPLDDAAKGTFPEAHLLSYAMGWNVSDYRGTRIVQHAGWIDGYRVHLTLLPEQHAGFAILCNLDGTRMNLAASNSLADLLLALPEKDWNAYFGRVEEARAKKAEAEKRQREAGRQSDVKPTLPLAAYAGEYEHSAYDVCKVVVDKQSLRWEWSSFKKQLRHYRGDIFDFHDATLGDQLLTFTVKGNAVVALHVLDFDFKKIK